MKNRDECFEILKRHITDEVVVASYSGAVEWNDLNPRALILIQYTGFLDSLNAIRAGAVEYKQPIVMMVGLLGHEPERLPADSGRYGVRIIEPICDAMGIAHHLISEDADVAKIKPAIDKAYAESSPVALLIGRRPS